MPSQVNPNLSYSLKRRRKRKMKKRLLISKMSILFGTQKVDNVIGSKLEVSHSLLTLKMRPGNNC